MALKIKKNRTIVLPIDEKNYDLFVNDLDTARVFKKVCQTFN